MTSVNSFVSRLRRFHFFFAMVAILCLAPACRAADASIYDFSLVQMDGSEVHLSSYKGKALLIVNLARNSTYSDQLAALDKVYQAYKDQGLVVLGVPANDFGAQEPGTDAEVRKAYADMHLGFPVMARVSVRGKEEIPLYGFLTGGKDKSLSGDVHWNLTKFIVDRSGQVVARFETDVDPASPRVRMTIEKVLAGTFKKDDKAKDEGTDAKGGDDEEDDGPED